MLKRKQRYFLKLYQPVHDRFERFCRARAYYDMPYEDLMNETLLVAFKKFNTLKNEAAFLGFLIGISTRILANARRKKKNDFSRRRIGIAKFSSTGIIWSKKCQIAIYFSNL